MVYYKLTGNFNVLCSIGLHLENFIQPDLHDVEIQVLTGSVLIEVPETDARNNVTLSTGEKIKVCLNMLLNKHFGSISGLCFHLFSIWFLFS